MVAVFPTTPADITGFTHTHTRAHTLENNTHTHRFMLKKDHQRGDVPSVAVQHNVFQFTFIMLYQLNMV